MLKKICLISVLFFYQNIYASHEPCIAIYPTPTGCIHDHGDDNDNKNIVIAGAVVAGVYFYLNKDQDIDSFDINDGLSIYKGKNVKVSFLSNRYYQQNENIYKFSTTNPLNGLDNYQNYNIFSIDFSPWIERP